MASLEVNFKLSDYNLNNYYYYDYDDNYCDG